MKTEERGFKYRNNGSNEREDTERERERVVVEYREEMKTKIEERGFKDRNERVRERQREEMKGETQREKEERR